MKIETLERFKDLSLMDRARALTLPGFRLTISARDAMTLESSLGMRKLIGINELQHRVLSQAGHYLDGEESRAYPVDVFGQILTETAAHHDLASMLDDASAYAIERIDRKAK